MINKIATWTCLVALAVGCIFQQLTIKEQNSWFNQAIHETNTRQNNWNEANLAGLKEVKTFMYCFFGINKQLPPHLWNDQAETFCKAFLGYPSGK